MNVERHRTKYLRVENQRKLFGKEARRVKRGGGGRGVSGTNVLLFLLLFCSLVFAGFIIKDHDLGLTDMGTRRMYHSAQCTELHPVTAF